MNTAAWCSCRKPKLASAPVGWCPWWCAGWQSQEDKELVGSAQIDALLQDPNLPFADSFCVDVGDTSYSKPACLHSKRHHAQLVSIARLRGTRVLYRPFVPDPTATSQSTGRPRRFGDRFAPARASYLARAGRDGDAVRETSRRGQGYRVEIKAWHNMLMRGKNKPYRMPMERYPFTLLQVVRYDAGWQSGL